MKNNQQLEAQKAFLEEIQKKLELDDINENENKNKNEIKIEQQEANRLKLQQVQQVVVEEEEEDQLLLLQQEADKLAAEALKKLLKEKTFFDKDRKTKINSILSNTTSLTQKDIKTLSNNEKILLLSKAPLEDARYKDLKADDTIKFDNSPTSIKALLKKNNGNYKEAIEEIKPEASQNNGSKIRARVFKKFISTTNEDNIKKYLEEDLKLKASLSKISNDASSNIKIASEVAFSLVDGSKKISKEKTTKIESIFSKKELTPTTTEELTKTVKIISSLIGKSKGTDKEITASKILSNTVTINDRRLKLLGYVYKDNLYITGTADEILENSTINTLEEKKKFIEAVGYKFSFEIKDDEIDKNIKELEKFGWKINDNKATFTKPKSYDEFSKDYLNNFIQKSLNAIEVSKEATKASEPKSIFPKTTGGNLKNILKVHKIVGLKSNAQQNTI